MNSLIQPYFVMSTSKYYKAVKNQLGISHFYTFNKEAAQNINTLAVPDGCIDILFSCDSGSPSAHVCGSVLQPTHVLQDASHYFGVRFYPGAGYNYKDVQTKEIINSMYNLTDILDAKEMFEKIVSTKDFNAQVQLFTDHYKQYLHNSDINLDSMDLKQYMLNRIFKVKGQIKVRELAEATGYSERYLNRKFTEFFGISPKVFCKIIRFQHVLNQLNQKHKISEEKSLIHIANDAGYYDQAHMYKDFNEFSNHTPGHYMELIKQSSYTDRLVLVNDRQLQ